MQLTTFNCFLHVLSEDEEGLIASSPSPATRVSSRAPSGTPAHYSTARVSSRVPPSQEDNFRSGPTRYQAAPSAAASVPTLPSSSSSSVTTLSSSSVDHHKRGVYHHHLQSGRTAGSEDKILLSDEQVLTSSDTNLPHFLCMFFLSRISLPGLTSQLGCDRVKRCSYIAIFCSVVLVNDVKCPALLLSPLFNYADKCRPLAMV